MIGLVRREVEILVHTTAPSRGQDDARYRALAQAYLEFEPANAYGLEFVPRIELEENADVQVGCQLQDELVHSTLEERESQKSYRPDDLPETASITQSNTSLHGKALRLELSELSEGIASPILSFSGALDNADSPVWRGFGQQSPKILKKNRRKNSQGSWKLQPNEIADSQPEINRTIPELSSPTRILELYLQQIQSSGELSSSSCGMGINKHQTIPPSPEFLSGIRRSQSTHWERVEECLCLTSTVPSSPSPRKGRQKHSQCFIKQRNCNVSPSQNPETSLKRRRPESTLDDSYVSSFPATRLDIESSTIIEPHNDIPLSTQDPAMIPKENFPGSSSGDSHIRSSAPTRLAIESSTVRNRKMKFRKKQCIDSFIDEITSRRDVASSKFTVVTASSSSSLEAKSIWDEKSEIRPPPPLTSTADLTPEMLLTPSLQQLAQKMPLKELFRPKDQTRDLRSMERGYWRVRFENWDSGVRNRCWECLGNFIGRGLGGWGVWCIRDDELDTLKVYCWGTVVRHVYLLLYMASESRIKGTGARWVGGNGEAIITMPT